MRQLAQLALRREPAIIRSLFFLAPLITLLIPKTTVAMLIVLFLCCVGLESARGGSLRDLFRVDMTLVLFGIAAAYLFLNATWSLDPARAFTASSWFVLIVLMCFSSARALARWLERSLRMAATAFAVGIGAGVAVILFEAASDRLATISLYNAFPFTQPDSLKGFGWRAGAHAHNAFLQTWYELGAIGVILFMVTGSAVILSLGRLPRDTQRLALAQVAAVLAIIAFARGMWQAWLMALIGLAALYIALAVNVYRASQPETNAAAP